jgi:tetratricopeptide (TPR) repeat protein
MLGREQEASESYRKAIQTNQEIDETLNTGLNNETLMILDAPDQQGWFDRGIDLDNLGNTESVITSLSSTNLSKGNELRFNDDSDFLYNRNTESGESKFYKKAIDYLNKALAINPGDHYAWYYQGSMLALIGHYEEAIASFDQALTIKPDLYETWNDRCFSLIALGRYEEAIVSYNKVIELQPNYAIAHYNKARCYALQGKVEEAYEFLQRAIALDPENREMAKTDSAFDGIREDERWRSLIEE